MVGVTATEAVTNAHAYIITFALGPAAYAVVAAINLLYRPLGVVTMALTQFERPHLARVAASFGYSSPALEKAVAGFMTSLVLTWLANVLVVIIVYFTIPSYFSRVQDTREIVGVIVLVTLIMLLRTLRAPESAAMQATGNFYALAKIALIASLGGFFIFSSVFILDIVNIFIFVFAIFIGEMIFLYLNHRIYKNFRQGYAK